MRKQDILFIWIRETIRNMVFTQEKTVHSEKYCIMTVVSCLCPFQDKKVDGITYHWLTNNHLRRTIIFCGHIQYCRSKAPRCLCDAPWI